MDLALSIYAPNKMISVPEIGKSCDNFRHKLEELNNAKKGEIDMHFYAAVDNILSAVRYERLNPSGPKLKTVSAQHPLVP
ncbi:Glycogen debranching enzyme, partial [Stegodyphus mimosarum]